MWGCKRISDRLKLQGNYLSSPTVQKILHKHGMGSCYERLLKLEEKALKEKIPLTPKQIRAIEKAAPCFRERRVESKRPGELLCQNAFYVGRLKGVGKVYMQAVADAFGSFAFACLHVLKLPEHSAVILHNEALRQYEKWGLEVKAILTDNGREYCGREDRHPYQLYLALNDIAVLDEFLRPAFRKEFYETVKALEKDLDKWLKHYNYERPPQGYRNMGKRPFDTVKKFIKISPKKVD